MEESDYIFDVKAHLPDPDSYFIKLDKRWKLDEFGEFTKNYEQSYYAAFALEALKDDGILGADTQARLLYQMGRYPWRGGYSTIHFYYGLKLIIGRKKQPELKSIKYSSPGFIELSAVQEIALNLGVIVGSVCGSIKLINSTYNTIYKGLRDRQLNDISVERAQLALAKDQIDFLKQSVDEMGKHLNFHDPAKLIKATGSEFRALKILLSMYRRIRIVAKYQEEKKVLLPAQKEENTKNQDSLS